MTIFSFMSPRFQTGFVLDMTEDGVKRTAILVGLMVGSAVFGYLLGLWVRSLRPREVCSCHNPVWWALWRYAGISAILLIAAACCRPQCRDSRTGKFVSCEPVFVKRAPQNIPKVKP